jgi:hypothetical protein
MHGVDYNRHLNFKKWFEKNANLFPGPAFYDFTREEQLEHMMKLAYHIRKSPEVVDELMTGGYVDMYNIMDYMQGSVSIL